MKAKIVKVGIILVDIIAWQTPAGWSLPFDLAITVHLVIFPSSSSTTRTAIVVIIKILQSNKDKILILWPATKREYSSLDPKKVLLQHSVKILKTAVVLRMLV